MCSATEAESSTSAASQMPLLVTFKEKLSTPVCSNSKMLPQVSVSYSAGAPRLVEKTTFVPVSALVSVTSRGCKCKACTQLFTENFVVAFQGFLRKPESISISSAGKMAECSHVKNGKAFGCMICDSLTVEIA